MLGIILGSDIVPGGILKSMYYTVYRQTLGVDGELSD